MFRYEADDSWWQWNPVLDKDPSVQDEVEQYHVHLMMDAGLLIELGQDAFRMTATGHDFLDAIRDDTVWSKVKTGAAKAGAGSLEFMFGLAKAYVKQSVQEKLGIQL